MVPIYEKIKEQGCLKQEASDLFKLIIGDYTKSMLLLVDSVNFSPYLYEITEHVNLIAEFSGHRYIEKREVIILYRQLLNPILYGTISKKVVPIKLNCFRNVN